MLPCWKALPIIILQHTSSLPAYLPVLPCRNLHDIHLDACITRSVSCAGAVCLMKACITAVPVGPIPVTRSSLVRLYDTGSVH